MNIRNLSLAAASTVLLWSCSGGSKEPSALIAQADRLNGELSVIAENSPMFLDSICVDYADATLDITIALADTLYSADDFGEAFVQYSLADYMKGHTGENLDVIVNTLSKEQGKMSITMLDSKGLSKTFDIPASRLKQLIKLKPMELNYNEARDNMVSLLEKRGNFYVEKANAESFSFEIKAGFAEYTLVFATAAPYKTLNQAQLTGRYLALLKPVYDDFGECRHFIEDLQKSFNIEGYRFVYTDAKETNTIKASLPWRIINK